MEGSVFKGVSILTGLAVLAVAVFISGPQDEQRSGPEFQPEAMPDQAATGSIPPSPAPERAPEPRTETALPEEVATETQTARRELSSRLQADLALLGPDSDFEDFLHRFAGEPEDSAWARVTEAHLLDLLGQTGNLRAADIEIDCRTVTCRVRMTGAEFEPGAKFNNFIGFVDATGLEKAWELTGLHDGYGNRVDFVYLKRE
ncbi:hypothetical protein F6455_09980 [Proteobacteria bacterium 005FR1]|nr:hypothetical protein [Proteobacteria bacterium 005FR1]